MKNRKSASLLAAGALMTAMATTSVFAATPAVSNPVCTISSCTQTADHQHDNKTYAAHTANDGHDYHINCGVSGCTQSGSHQHNSNHNNGGHGHNGQRSGHHHG